MAKWTKPEVCLLYDKGKVIVGEISYNESWREEWLKGGNPELCAIQFKDGEAPESTEQIIKNKDVKTAMDGCKNEFSSTVGIEYDDWVRMDEDGQETFRSKGKRRDAGILEDGPISGELFMDGKKIMDVSKANFDIVDDRDCIGNKVY